MSEPAATDPASIVAAARALADDLLFPTALDTDRGIEPPRSHLDALADAGLYGLSVPRSWGGLGADAATAGAVVEALAGGCLSTAFVWLQHQNPARTIASIDGPAQRWARDLAAGRLRAGIAFAHLRRSGPPMLRARPVDGGWRVDGAAPWVSGWGCIDVVHVAAIHAEEPGTIVWLLIDAVETAALTTVPLPLVAMTATATVELSFRGHVVPADRCTKTEPLDAWLARDRSGLRGNGSLSLGLAARASTLLAGVFDARIEAAREALDEAAAGSEPAALEDARAAASLLARDATTALVVDGGGRSLRSDAHAQRLARESLFLLVQGQTHAIRDRQLARLEQNWNDA